MSSPNGASDWEMGLNRLDDKDPTIRRRPTYQEAREACIAKGYDPEHINFHTAVDHEVHGYKHDPCKWCGAVAFERIGGELRECFGCREVTTRLGDFLRRGGKAAHEFVKGLLK